MDDLALDWSTVEAVDEHELHIDLRGDYDGLWEEAGKSVIERLDDTRSESRHPCADIELVGNTLIVKGPRAEAAVLRKFLQGIIDDINDNAAYARRNIERKSAARESPPDAQYLANELRNSD